MTPYTYPCRVLRIVDGDTVDIELDLGFDVRMKERVRIAGIDAPETVGPNASPEGTVARDFVIKWVEDRVGVGRFVYQSVKYNARDKYGRSLGILAWFPQSGHPERLDEALITSGLAFPRSS